MKSRSVLILMMLSFATGSAAQSTTDEEIRKEFGITVEKLPGGDVTMSRDVTKYVGTVTREMQTGSLVAPIGGANVELNYKYSASGFFHVFESGECGAIPPCNLACHAHVSGIIFTRNAYTKNDGTLFSTK